MWKPREWPRGWRMPGPRAVQNLQMPHPRDWQGVQMPRSSPEGGGLGAGGIDWCISLRKISLFSRNRHFVHCKLQVGNQIGKDLFHGQCNVCPNLLQKNKLTCQKSETLFKHIEKPMRSYLSGLRINIALIFMSSSSYLVPAISSRRILLKYRFL